VGVAAGVVGGRWGWGLGSAVGSRSCSSRCIELGNDDLRGLGLLPAQWWSSRVCFGKSELLASNQLGDDDSLQCCVVPRHLGGLVIRWFGYPFLYIKLLFPLN
jgi:hypothetical protein